MAILGVGSLVFLYLALKSALQARLGSRFDGYFILMICLSAGAAVLPIRHAMFEARLADVAEALLNHDDIYVDCQSYLDSMFHLGFAGFVYRGSSRINLEVRTCSDLQDYLDDPHGASMKELYGLHVLTHEAMHVAGEFDEPVADCQAFQRNHIVAGLLGVPRETAIRNAQDLHQHRSNRHPYYSPECKPGGEMDERLPSAVWGSRS